MQQTARGNESAALIQRNRYLQALLFERYATVVRAARAGELIDADDIADAKLIADEIAASREELAQMVESFFADQ